jgi:hypothetical protein
VASCLFAVALLSRVALAQQPLKQPSNSSTNAKAATLDTGTISGDAYRNNSLAFSYKIPFGWVNRTKEMGEDSNDDSTPDSTDSKKSIVLLAAFERPPESTGDSVNSAVVIAAEPASSYPGLRSPEQYFGPLTELTKAKGLNVVNEPYDFPVGATQVVRGDFSKPIGKLTMNQSTLVMIEKSYVISFTFIAGSEDEVDEFIARLKFDRTESSASSK